jgi:hypothetical protein
MQILIILNVSLEFDLNGEEPGFIILKGKCDEEKPGNLEDTQGFCIVTHSDI